jgi:hypothetical protein
VIEIKSRWDGRVLYTAQNAADVRQALTEAVKSRADLSRADLGGAYLGRAYLSRAYLSRAYLSGAYLGRAYLGGAYLSRAYLSRAYLGGAYLSRAYLSRAYLGGAYLGRAYLGGAYLSRADLSGARGLAAERVNDLLILLDQPGKIRAYKLVTGDYKSPIQRNGKLTYKVGETLEVANANTDPNAECAAGINVATLPWCLREWRPGYRVLVVEFGRKDIAAIPNGDSKFRLHRCKVVAEKTIDPVALGLVEPEVETKAAA